MGERHREPRNGAKEFLQRRFFRPVPGLVNWLREPTAHAVGYVVSPSGLGALVAAPPLCGAGNLALQPPFRRLFRGRRSVFDHRKAPAKSRRQPGLAAPQSGGAATKMGARPEAPTRMSALRAWKPAPRGL